MSPKDGISLTSELPCPTSYVSFTTVYKLAVADVVGFADIG
jgi:hypothetical protein